MPDAPDVDRLADLLAELAVLEQDMRTEIWIAPEEVWLRKAEDFYEAGCVYASRQWADRIAGFRRNYTR